MINSFKQLSWKYLIANKQSSMLTIIAIVLAIALISTIGLIYKSMVFAQIEQVKNAEGSFHLVFVDVNESLFAKVKNHRMVSRFGLYQVRNDIRVGRDETVDEIRATGDALKLFTYKPTEGKLPENPNEIAVEKSILGQIDPQAKIGQNISIENKQFILVGIIENQPVNSRANHGIILTIHHQLDLESSALVVEIRSNVNLKKALSELYQLADEQTILPNTNLITVQGGNDESTGTSGMIDFVTILIGIVVFCSIAVIYNAFQIRVVERTKQFGLLRAVGAMPKQIRSIILGEATIMIIIAVPFGLLSGIAFVYVISHLFLWIARDSFLALVPVIDLTVLGVSAGVGILTVYLSAFLPMIFAGKISPLIAISSVAAIAKENVKKRNHRLVQMAFGFEGVMAARNMRRNKKRYHITVFSIMVGIVLFITFHYTLELKSQTNPIPIELRNIDFSVVASEIKEAYKINKNLEDNIRNLRFIDEVYGDYGTYFFDAAIDKKAMIKEVQAMGDVYKTVNYQGSETTILTSGIAVYDQASMEVAKKYVASGSIDIPKINQENGVILVGTRRMFEGDQQYSGPMADLKVGDELVVQDINLPIGAVPPAFGKGYTTRVKVMAVVQIEPFQRMGDMNVLQLMTTVEVAKRLVEYQAIQPINLNIKITDVKKEEQVKKEIENQLQFTPYLGLINHIYEHRREQETTLMIKILAYGLIVVVSFIGSMNVINTLMTTIMFRKKEFAALKSIGLTQNGLNKMVIIEGLLYGIVGTVYGTIISCGLCYLIYQSFDVGGDIAFRIPWVAMMVAGLCALLLGVFSTLIPLSMMKKDDLIQVLRA